MGGRRYNDEYLCHFEAALVKLVRSFAVDADVDCIVILISKIVVVVVTVCEYAATKNQYE